MTDTDREKWDLRYRKDMGGFEPSGLLESFYGLAFPKKALDIACGNGRNSLFLAQKGFEVDAIDISQVATAQLAQQDPGIKVICRDLDKWTIPENRYGLILNVRFLDQRLFPMILRGLKSGGILIFESFLGKKNQAYCLESNELLHAFISCKIVYYEEKKIEGSEKFDQTVSLVAIKK
ncbi:MAG: class I SAM-dependent methyltransferase [Proteobacteria bacterium]|nr:class I SAM-dependent methyltransferase [Pseudomonadota bacterium]